MHLTKRIPTVWSMTNLLFMYCEINNDILFNSLYMKWMVKELCTLISSMVGTFENIPISVCLLDNTFEFLYIRILKKPSELDEMFP